jgi:hypothetical protein
MRDKIALKQSEEKAKADKKDDAVLKKERPEKNTQEKGKSLRVQKMSQQKNEGENKVPSKDD